MNFVKQCRVPVTVVSVAIDKRLKKDAIKLVRRVKRLMAEGGVKVETDVRTGIPHEAIVASAREHDADLIVVGRQPRPHRPGQAVARQRLRTGYRRRGMPGDGGQAVTTRSFCRLAAIDEFQPALRKSVPAGGRE